MATNFDIINLALRRLGLEAISSLSDSNRGKVMNTLYDQVRKAALEEFHWPFAIKRAKLQEDFGATPEFEYSHAHELPADYIKAISEFNDTTYIREGEFVLSDSSEILLRYVADISDTTKFNPLFIKTFYLMLAQEAAYSLVQDKGLMTGLTTELGDVFSKARTYASQESTPKDFEVTDFLDVRY